MSNKSIAIVFLLFLSGCASTKNITMDHSTASLTKPATVVISNRESPDFSAATAGKALFGVVGVLSMLSEGKKIVEQNNVEDPAHFISTEIFTAISQGYQLELINSDKIVSGNNIRKISAAYATADWVIDVETLNWGFMYLPADWNNYWAFYTARVKIIDTRDQAIIAQWLCPYQQEDDGATPSYDEFLLNNAERLKQEIQKAAVHCINEFTSNALNS